MRCGQNRTLHVERRPNEIQDAPRTGGREDALDCPGRIQTHCRAIPDDEEAGQKRENR
jgi:hypothetical protein